MEKIFLSKVGVRRPAPVTDLILLLIVFRILALTTPSLGSFTPFSLIEQLSG
ncbi:hypothetical protein PL11201_410061 [Planktothrix sp. PCC 11201]|nr:hypothetical protein PL11201_410061 [Planktothrix sp. PCC 11201]